MNEMTKKEKIYLVMSSSGSRGDYFEYAIFATKDREYAENYVKKLSELIKKTRCMLEPYCKKINGYWHLKEEYYNSWQCNRWEQTHNLNEPFITETELR